MVLLICGLSAVLLYLVLSGSIGFHNAIVDNEKYSLLGTVIQTTGTFAAVALAMVFLTAQLGGVGRPSVIRELYRSKDVYVFFGYSAATVLVGYVAMLTTGSLGAPWNDRVLDSVFILAGASLLLVLPALMSQIENLDQTRLAAKLASRIRVDEVIEYGRADAYPVPGISPQDYGKLPHARPSDPLRPLHELIKEAVYAQDRVLFGRLFRLLLTPVARAHGLKWDYHGLKRERSRKAGWITRLKSKEYNCEQKTDVAKVILNYSVKRSRNLLHNSEWGELDVGRHAILAGISNLIRSLARVKDGASTINLCLYAAFHIEETYRGVEPHGHIEPMNAFFDIGQLLFEVDEKPAAKLCARILGWVSVHTKQLSPDRASGMGTELCEELKIVYGEAVRLAQKDPNWTPIPEDDDDPWKNRQ
jgi:hypothetical protein